MQHFIFKLLGKLFHPFFSEQIIWIIIKYFIKSESEGQCLISVDQSYMKFAFSANVSQILNSAKPYFLCQGNTSVDKVGHHFSPCVKYIPGLACTATYQLEKVKKKKKLSNNMKKNFYNYIPFIKPLYRVKIRFFFSNK